MESYLPISYDGYKSDSPESANQESPQPVGRRCPMVSLMWSLWTGGCRTSPSKSDPSAEPHRTPGSASHSECAGRTWSETAPLPIPSTQSFGFAAAPCLYPPNAITQELLSSNRDTKTSVFSENPPGFRPYSKSFLRDCTARMAPETVLGMDYRPMP